MKYVEAAARSIGEGLAKKTTFHVVVMRCSVPPGTTLNLMAPIIEETSSKKLGLDFGICFNPEFLREGVAVEDFYAPPKTVVGVTDDRSKKIMRNIYNVVDNKIIFTSVETAELVKYVDNVWQATKVTFANEVGRLCKPLGVDSHEVMDVFVRATKLNLSPYYLKPGFSYGGSCLPKEVRAVAHIANKTGVNLPLVGSLDQSNRAHIETAINMVRKTGAKRVAVLGLAFKPGTDDLRESPILDVIAALHTDGKEVLVNDPAITNREHLANQLSYLGSSKSELKELQTCMPAMFDNDVDNVVAQADVVIVTHK